MLSFLALLSALSQVLVREVSSKPMAPFIRDTIYALASASGRAGVAVIRVSGPNADAALQALTDGPLPALRRAVIRTIYDKTNSDRIDRVLVLRFNGPGSYTGENVVEIQCHGGYAVVAGILSALGRITGLRLAEPGEFTRRAVENGRLDLTQAEAIADLVEAQTQAQRRQALRQLGGHLGMLCEDWRTKLIRAAAWIEAAIDFADEDIPDDAALQSRAALEEIRAQISAHLHDERRGEILREGLQIAVIGPPNSGKSSLVNALAKSDVAIVSERAGTTRDVIEVRLNLKGFAVILADTAGLRESDDAIEREGVRRARARAEAADVCLLVLDGAAPEPDGDWGLEADFTVWNKADLVVKRTRPGLWVSAKTGQGLESLIDRLAGYAQTGMSGEAPVLTRARHRSAFEEAEDSLGRALETKPEDHELVAEHVRRALNAIGRITGRVDLDDLLDVVFRDFCIGK